MPPATTPRPRFGGTLAPLQHQLFFAVWSANVFSNLGGQIQQVGTSWLMTLLAPSPQIVALVAFATSAPVLFFSLLAGAVADVYDRRLVLLSAQVLMLVASTTLTVAAFAGFASPLLLLAATFLISCGFALNAPAWQAIVGELVPREDLPAAVALNTVGFNVARTLGPGLGGLVIALTGPNAAFAINATTYFALIVVLLRWRRAPIEQGLTREPVTTALAAGLRYVCYSPLVRTVLLRSCALGLGASVVIALVPLVARDLLEAGPLAFGMLLTCSGCGAIVGGTFSTFLRRRFSYEKVVCGAVACYALAVVAIGLSRSLPLTGAALAVTGGSMVLILSTFNIAVQMSVPRWVVGRAISVYQMAIFGGMAIGSLIWGRLATATSLRIALIAAGCTLAATLLLGWRWPLRGIDPDHLAPAYQPDDAHPSVGDADPHAPVVVTIEYRIGEERRDEFLGAMRERRRIRLRDGARGWTLLQDAQEPDRWVERFHSRTWLEYLRHRQRRTAEDRAMDERLRTLDGTGTLPVHFLFERFPDARKNHIGPFASPENAGL